MATEDLGEGGGFGSAVHGDSPTSSGHHLESSMSVGGARPFASWWQRVGALLIDLLLVWGGCSIALPVLHAFASTTIVDPRTGVTHRYVPFPFDLVEVTVLASVLAYFATLDGHSQTVGKRAVGIAVRDQATQKPIGFGRALGRWLIFSFLWLLLIIPGLVNALSPNWDRKRQAWHDHAVGSIVVRVR